MKEKEKTLKRKIERKLKVCLREITIDVDTLMQEINKHEFIEYLNNSFNRFVKEHPMDVEIQLPVEMFQPIIWGDAL